MIYIEKVATVDYNNGKPKLWLFNNKSLKKDEKH